MSTQCPVSELRSRHQQLPHDMRKHYTGLNAPDRDGEKRHDIPCTLVAEPVDQSSKHFVAALRFECRISLGVPPVRIKGSKNCVKTDALLDTGSDVTVVQRGLLKLVCFKASTALLSVSTVNGAATWVSGITDLMPSSLSGKECVHFEIAFCIETLTIQLARYCPDADVRLCPHLQCVPRRQPADVRERIPIGADVRGAHRALEQSFGRWK